MSELLTDAIEECIFPAATAVYGYARASDDDSDRATKQLQALLDEIEDCRAETRRLFKYLTEHRKETELLRGLIKSFVYEWGQSELGASNGTGYFAAFHRLKQVVSDE